MGAVPDVVFVTHETQRSGAPILLLNLLRWLGETTDLSFAVAAAADGPLVAELGEVAPVVLGDEAIAGQLAEARLVYANSTWSHALLDRAPDFAAPVVSHVHELRSLLRQVDPLHAGKRPHRYIAVSEQVRATLVADYGIAPDDVVLCKDFIPVHDVLAHGGGGDAGDAGDPADLVDWTAFGLPAGCRVVGTVGSLWPTKGTDLFVDLAASLLDQQGSAADDVHFVWVGGPPALVPIFEGYVRDRGLDHRVHVLGEYEKPFRLMRALDVFVLPSREEAFSLVVLEAGVLERPVVSFDCGAGVREVLADGRGVLVEPEDVTAMSQEVAALLADDARRARLGTALAGYVTAEYDVAVRAPDILRVIDAALGR